MTDIGYCAECGWRGNTTEADFSCLEGHRSAVVRTDLGLARFTAFQKEALKRFFTRKTDELDEIGERNIDFQIWYGELLYHIDDLVRLPVEGEDDDDDY